MPEIYVITAFPLKCVAVLFRMSPEDNTTLSAIKAYNGYQLCHRVLWIDGLNPRGLKCDNRKSYVGGWIYPEYSVAWLIPVDGQVARVLTSQHRG